MSEDLAELFRRHVCQTSDAPMGMIVQRADGTRVWSDEGVEYLDLLAGMGVANIGHRHPEVVAAIADQLARYLHVMVYGEFVQDTQVRLATRLAGLLPAPLEVVYFTNSGAEEGSDSIDLTITASGCSDHVALNQGITGTQNIEARFTISTWPGFSVTGGGDATLEADSRLFIAPL